MNCYITEQIETTPYTQARLQLPESFTTGRTYLLQFARRVVFAAGGEQVALDLITETDTALILPPYLPPKPGVLEIKLIARLIDFAKTPLVTVDLLYEDEANDVREATTLAFDDTSQNQSWTLSVKDVNRRLFRLEATYFVAPENTPHITEAQFSSTNLVVLPRFVSP